MSNWISAVVGITALLAFLGTGATFVFRGKQDARIKSLEESNDDLRNDVGDRDKRIVFLENANNAKTAAIHSLEAQVVALEKLKLGETYFHAMHDQVEAHTVKVMANHEKLLAEMSTVRKQNRDILALLADQRRHP